MIEREIGNRGSKSVKSYFATVKEQRVNGSYVELNSILRCTLMGFEKNYLVNSPFNSIIFKRNYSKLS